MNSLSVGTLIDLGQVFRLETFLGSSRLLLQSPTALSALDPQTLFHSSGTTIIIAPVH